MKRRVCSIHWTLRHQLDLFAGNVPQAPVRTGMQRRTWLCAMVYVSCILKCRQDKWGYLTDKKGPASAGG